MSATVYAVQNQKKTSLEVLIQGENLFRDSYGLFDEGEQIHILRKMYEDNALLRKVIHYILCKNDTR